MCTHTHNKSLFWYTFLRLFKAGVKVRSIHANTPKSLHNLVMDSLRKRAIMRYPPWSDLLLPDVAEVPVCDDSLPVLDRSRS